MTHTKEPLMEFIDLGESGCPTYKVKCSARPNIVMEDEQYYPSAPDKDDARRFVECYNALAGIENPAEWVERAKKALGEE